MAESEVVRQPPQDLEAEMSLLGGILLDPPTVGQVLQIIPREESASFYRPDHRMIYEAVVDLYDQAKPCDAITLRDELQRRGQLEQVGGVNYLVELTESVPSAANVEYYARIVRDKHMLREMIRCAGGIVEDCYAQSQPAAELMDDAEKKLFDVTEKRIRGSVVHMSDVLRETMEQIEARDGHHITGVPTGFTELDDLTSGLQRGELVIIAARPSMGKTALGMSMAEHVAVDEGLPTLFFSLEMSRQQIALRLISMRGRIEAHRIRRGMISAEEQAHLALVCGDLSEKPLYVDDTSAMSVMELRAKARRLKQQHDVQVIYVDYLQLMHDPKAGRESRQNEIAAISRGLKSLARELRIPVVALAQLNRNPEGREGNRPRMSDLRESGAIEQDADVIILLHREEYYLDQKVKKAGEGGETVIDADVRGKAELIVAKQRNGPIGVVEVHFDKHLTRFANLHPGQVTEDYAPAAAAPSPAFANETYSSGPMDDTPF